MVKKHKILFSAHRDTVMPHYRLEYKSGKMIGLLDNSIGQLVVNSVIISEPNVSALEKADRIKVFFGQGEEWGLLYGHPTMEKNDIVVVVDVACGDQYKGLDFSLENISGFTKKEITDIREHLEWENFSIKTKMFDGNPDDEDEAWSWKNRGHRVISFIIPIEAGHKDTGWHVDNCSIEIEKIRKAIHGLTRLTNILL